ncbi:MAG: bacillithiol biosynthesis deacetylase BshB1 [bacterium]|nr:bacillithiol biosynthesis deacetylase BshB1 [bacterium]
MMDILAIGAHPDDIEMFMGGTMLKMKELGYKTAICDLTRGEAGTYGDADTREEELEKAADMLGLDTRITLDMPDGNVRNTEENRLKVIEVIRQLQPRLVFSFANVPMRHPDHYNCGYIVKESCYLAGLRKLETQSPAYRPHSYIGFPEMTFDTPSFVIDITSHWEKRQETIRCFGTQVIKPGEDDSNTKTFIRSNRFWEIQEARAVTAGAFIGVKYGEPFFSPNPPQVVDPVSAFNMDLK